MSQNPSTSASLSKFQLIIIDALKVYNKRTKNDILLHPLATQLQNCQSPSDVRTVLQEQVQGPHQSQSGDDRRTKWLDPTIHVLLTFSQAVGTLGLVCPQMRFSVICTLIFIWQAFSPTTVVFAGIGILLSVCILHAVCMRHSNTYCLQAAKDVRASQDTLFDIFERMEMFFRRLEMYTEVPLTTEMTDVIIEIMAEVLSILGIATKEIKQSRTSE